MAVLVCTTDAAQRMKSIQFQLFSTVLSMGRGLLMLMCHVHNSGCVQSHTMGAAGMLRWLLPGLVHLSEMDTWCGKVAV